MKEGESVPQHLKMNIGPHQEQWVTERFILLKLRMLLVEFALGCFELDCIQWSIFNH